MRALYLILLLAAGSLTYAQQVADDFEAGTPSLSWEGDDCNLNPDRANPFPNADNGSATVLEYHDVGGTWANVRFQQGESFDLANYSRFSVKLYVSSAGLTGSQSNQVSLKLQNGDLPEPWSTQTEIIKPIVLDQWQTLVFDFATGPYMNLDAGSLPPVERTDFNRLLIQINGENNNDQVLAYIDDFTQLENEVVDGPIFDYLVWSDEFETPGPVSVDATRWFHQTQLPLPGSWYNGEIQHYTDRLENAVVEDGVLKIIARRETFTDQGFTKEFTSARLNSKFAFQYGRVEIRAKLPTGVGTWPALWMLGKNIDEDGGYWDILGFGTDPWPDCGEIDIMEHWGDNQDYISSAMHTPSSFGGTVNVGGRILPNASTEFHVYELEWTNEQMVFSVDGVVHYTYRPEVRNADTWPFDAEQYFLFNVAMLPNVVPEFSESAMEVDYIRVYQESPISSTTSVEANQSNYYPNPFDDRLTIKLEESGLRELQISILSLDGKTILSRQLPVVNQQVTLDELGGLPRGMYLLSYRDMDKQFSIKIFKE